MLYGGVAWVHFFLIISGCRARQVVPRALGWWSKGVQAKKEKEHLWPTGRALPQETCVHNHSNAA